MAALKESLGATITMASDGTLQFFAVSITAPGLEVAEIDLTTLAATRYRTYSLSTLVTVGDLTIEALYDTSVWSDLLTNMGVNTLFTVTLPPDGGSHSVVVYAAIKSANFSAFVAGEAPKITLVVKPTLRHSSTGAETAPSYA